MKIVIKSILFFIFTINVMANGIWVWDTKEDWERCDKLDCDVITNSGSLRILNVISDDFNGPTLNARWIWRDEGISGNRYDLTANPGCVRLISDAGTSSWCGTYTTLKLEQYVDKTKNFIVEVCIKNSSLYSHEWGLFEFYVRGEDYKSMLGIGDGSNRNSYDLHVRGDCYVYKRMEYYYPYPFYIKIENLYNYPYNTITLSYRPNTYTAWTVAWTFNNLFFDNMYFGLSRSDTEANQYVDIDYFYYYGPVTRRAEINSGAIDLGSEPVGQGIIRWVQNLPDLSTHPIEFYTQTSDDGNVWSEEWKGPYTNNNGSNILSTNRRYIRFKGILKTNDERWSPELHRLEIEYPLAAPNAPVITGTVKEGEWANTTNAKFYFTGADSNGVTVAGYYYSIDEEVNTRSMYTNASYVSITNMAEGRHKISVIAQADYRNNSLCSGKSEYEFNVDVTNPKVPEVKSCSHKQYEETENNNFEIELILEDDKKNTTNVSGIGGISYKLTRDEKEEVDETIEEEGNKIRISGIDNGVWYFKVRAIDRAGNKSEEMRYCIKINYKGEILARGGVKIYPNPTKGRFKIRYELTGEAERVRIMIKDSGGRTFKEIEGGVKAGENEIEEELNGLANGVYFVKIVVERKDGKEDKIVKKVVVYRR